MSKYISIFFLSILCTIILFLILGSSGMMDVTDGFVMLIGIILTIQSSFIAALLFYVIDLVKKQHME
jgi:hypothetical protein